MRPGYSDREGREGEEDESSRKRERHDHKKYRCVYLWRGMSQSKSANQLARLTEGEERHREDG
jgi:hypothetical protein